MKALCRFTMESGEPVWLNPLQIRMVIHAKRTGAGTRIEFDQDQHLVVMELPDAVASAVEEAVFRA
jgi:hypothetical protein